MVWWMHCSPTQRREGVHFGLKTERDIVCQTVSIMYDCHDYNYDGYDIHSLTNVGVNIFNVDMTQYDAEFFRKIKEAMELAAKMPEMIPTAYCTPVGMCVTMSVNDPINVDDRVDMIILKDITSTTQLRQFKKENKKIAAMPILFWPPTLQIKDLSEIIQERKPVFFMNPTLVDNYYEENACDRQLLIEVQELMKSRIDGFFLRDQRVGKPPIEFIQSFIRATEIIEKKNNATAEYLKMSFELKLPVLQPYATALAASLASLQCGASAIIVFTTSGASAKVLSCSSPPCHVIAVTRHEKTARRMHLYRKVLPLHYRQNRLLCWQDESLARIAFGTQFGLDTGLFNFASNLVVLAPSEEGITYCNSFNIVTVKHILQQYECGQYIRGADDG